MDSLKEIFIIITLISLAFILGLQIDAVGWSLFGASLIWIGLQAREFRKIRQWANRPLQRPQNGLESWAALAYLPFRSLTRERERTRAMVLRLREILSLTEIIPDGFIVLNSSGDIESLNAAAKKLLHLSDKDVGLGLGTVVRIPEFLNFIRTDQQQDPIEFQSPFATDTTLEARRLDTELGGAIVIVRDVTTLNRLLTMRQNFIANVSHELRTPLTVVSGYMETLTDPDEDPALKLGLIERLPSPLRRMQSLVDDLLLLTQLESSSEVKQSAMSLAEPIKSAVEELRPMFSDNSQISVLIDTNSQIMGAQSELHSVCVNLLANAIRYSRNNGPITIRCEDLGGGVRLSVKDEGLGIAQEHLGRLTERFYRVDMAGSRTRGGTGLGLAIVKHVLRRHHSTLQIQSSLGVGSTFFCDFEKFSPGENPEVNLPKQEKPI